jgi:hypothetical protein
MPEARFAASDAWTSDRHGESGPLPGRAVALGGLAVAAAAALVLAVVLLTIG